MKIEEREREGKFFFFFSPLRLLSQVVVINYQ